MPRVKFTKEKIRQLKAICRVKPTLIDCATLLDINARTLERWIRKEFDQTFVEFREQNMAWTRHMIIRNIIKECEKGNVPMLIYASKNLCGWKDKWDTDVTSTSTIKIEKQDEEL